MLLIAEIGLNYEGSLPLAEELIRQAAACGADVAKFQLGWRDRPDEINHLDADRARRLKEACELRGVEFMASVITPEALEISRWLKPHRYKIASRTVVHNPALVEAVLAEDRETFVSLGFWRAHRGPTDPEFPLGLPTEKLRYLYCVSSYPAHPDELADLPERFGPEGYFGYSDHLLGIAGCLMAISRGARVVEKHFTLNKATISVHQDHALSADPAELRALHALGRPLYDLSRRLLK